MFVSTSSVPAPADVVATRQWEAGQDGAVADASADVTVVDLIRRLDEDRRAAFVLTQLLGLSYDEAARVCACPPGTIRSRVARARAELISLIRRSEPGRPVSRFPLGLGGRGDAAEQSHTG